MEKIKSLLKSKKTWTAIIVSIVGSLSALGLSDVTVCTDQATPAILELLK